jgi:hypothetical protein
MEVMLKQLHQFKSATWKWTTPVLHNKTYKSIAKHKLTDASKQLQRVPQQHTDCVDCSALGG